MRYLLVVVVLLVLTSCTTVDPEVERLGTFDVKIIGSSLYHNNSDTAKVMIVLKKERVYAESGENTKHWGQFFMCTQFNMFRMSLLVISMLRPRFLRFITR